MCQGIKISGGRYVEYREKDELFVVDIEKTDKKYLEVLKDYLIHFHGIIYLERGGNLEGIMTSNEIMKSIAESRLIINTNFFSIKNYDNKNKDFLENFFNKHRSIHCIPVVESGRLLGEFTLHVGSDNPFDKMHWNSIATTVKNYLGRVIKQNYKVAIPDNEECAYLKTIIYEMSDIAVVDAFSSDADIHILGKKELKQNFQYLVEGRRNKTVHSIDIYSLYRQCIVYHILETCRKRDIAFYYFEAPILEKIRDIDQEERKALMKNAQFETLIADEKVLEEFYGRCKSRYYIESRDYTHISLLDNGRYYQLCDYQGDYLNIIDGKRITCNEPECYKSTVHMFGSCIVRGHSVCDEETIGSFLQSEVNKAFPNMYRIVNYGVLGSIGNLNDFHYMLYTPMREHDTIICIGNYEDEIVNIFKERGVSCFELSTLFSGSHGLGRWWLDNTCHISPTANRIIAQYIYTNIHNYLEKKRKYAKNRFLIGEEKVNIDVAEKSKVEDYIKKVKGYCEAFDCWNCETVGAIVMNCNPFTNGHKYLIEQGALQVDTLLVFIVEEDKSYFPFEDRIHLVREGAKEFQNVIVIPSGKFIISSTTFPEYFNKNQLQEVTIDASRDIRIFCSYIAPELNITVRFAGEEPFDKVTAFYNQSMKEILPQYGVRFIEIPRRRFKNQVISASHVRKLLENSEWDEIKQIVPPVTYQYLRTL